MECAGDATFDTTLKDCICAINQYVVENFTTLEKTCSQDCEDEAWPGPLGTMVSACYYCPYEGQIYDRNTQSEVPTCECIETEYTPAAGKCIKNEDAVKFTDPQSEYSDSRAFQISYDSVETISGGTITTAPLTATSGSI